MHLRLRQARTAPLSKPASLALIALCLGGCGQSADDSHVTGGTEPPALECEVEQYACTWNEVDPAVKERSLDLSEIASRYGLEASVEDVATFLLDQPEVSQVERVGGSIRFRLNGGRPTWVVPEEEFEHHRQSGNHSSANPVVNDSVRIVAEYSPGETLDMPNDPLLDIGEWLGISKAYAQEFDEEVRGVAAETPGSPKRVLILSPYEWEWNAAGVGTTGEIMARRASLIRDFEKKNGGEVIFHADLDEFEPNPPGGAAFLSGQVQFDDFLHWDDYNLVVLASHGTEYRCAREVPTGGARSGPDPLYDHNNPFPKEDMCPMIYAGLAKQEQYGSFPGVEIYTTLGTEYRENSALTRLEAAYCAEALANWTAIREQDNQIAGPRPSTESGKPCQLSSDRTKDSLVLWTPFFEHRYPNGLNNTILFLAVCRSGINDVLLNVLAPHGNENVAVFAFNGTVDAGISFHLAYKLIEYVEKGLTNDEIRMLHEKDSQGQGKLVGRAMDLREELIPAGPPELKDAGGPHVHGRDIVMLVSPGGGELENGGSVRVQPIADSNQGDELELRPQIIGLEQNEARDIELKVRVVGEDVPDDAYKPFKAIEERIHRYDRNIKLGRKYTEGEVVDLEISTEFKSGHQSKWTYEDIRLTAADCAWSASVSGHSPATGSFSGTTGYTKITQDRWPPLQIEAIVQDEDPQPEPPWLEINLTNHDLATIRDASKVSSISIAIPGVQPGQTGTFNRVWGTLNTGPQSHDGNADYLRRNVIGLPGGTGIGKILSTHVTLSRNDNRVEGTFDARFLNGQAYRELGPYERAPVGVGMHTITGAAISASGDFSITADGSCRAKMGFRR